MADSERSQDRDDEVPDPQVQGDPLEKAGQDSGVTDQRDHEEPDRGVASWQFWIRLTGEALQLLNQILDLLNGSGG